MTAPVHQHEGEQAPAEMTLAATGERIERLLEACSTAGPLARERAEELVRLVVDLYGAGIRRILDRAYDAGVLTDEVIDSLADDELVSSLLLVHGLHPYSVEERIVRALDRVRPYLGSHGGDVELLEVTATGIARLRLLGSCDGCPSSAVTLSLAVEGAVTAAAPEVVSVEVVEAPAPSSASSPAVIPVEALSARLHARSAGPAATWEPVVALAAVPTGSVTPFAVADQRLVLTRIGAEVYAYLDSCPACGAALAGATLERRLSAGRTVVLTCPGCRAHYDAQRAGAGLDGTAHHLTPVPLLQRDGVLEVAVAGQRPSAVPA